MTDARANWTPWLLRAINRVQAAYIRDARSHVPLDLLIDSLCRLTRSSFGIAGELVTDLDGEPQVRFFQKGSASAPLGRLGRLNSPKTRQWLREERLAAIADILLDGEVVRCRYPNERLGRPDAGASSDWFIGIPLLTHDRIVGFVGLLRPGRKFAANLKDRLQPLLSTASNILDARQLQERRRYVERALKTGEGLRFSILETALDGILAVDELDRIIEFNPAAERMFGWRKSEILGQQFAATLCRPEKVSQYRTEREQLMRTGELPNRMQGSFEVALLRKDGSQLPVEVSVSQNPIGGRRIQTAIVRDITERIENDISRARMVDELEQANNAKRKFVATMSHEIRTPLNVIRGGLSLLDGSNLSHGQRDLLRIMHDSSDILLSLVNDVLDFSKIESDNEQPESIATDLAELIDTTIRVLSVRAFRSGTNLCFFIDPQTPKSIETDPGLIRQVLVNLVDNAIKYAPGGHVEIRLAPESQGVLRFEVIDDGQGIDPETVDTLFNEFSRAEEPATRPFAGAGLGLAIAKRLVEKLDGRIGADSGLDNGSRFWFTLPIHQANGVQATLSSDSPSIKALLVGSDKPWRAAVAAQLEAWGVDVVCHPESALRSEHDEILEQLADRDVMYVPAVNRRGTPLPNGVRALQAKGVKLNLLSPALGLMPECADEDFAITNHVVPLPLTSGELFRNLKQLHAPDADAARADVANPDEAVPSAFSAETRVLLAEDGQANRLVGETILRRLGLTVDTVANGAEAIEAVQSFHYDVVLMDISMPVMDGFEATRRIRALKGDDAHTPIIAISAHAIKGIRERCLESGMNDYVSKPININELLGTMTRVSPAFAATKQQAAEDEIRVEALHLERIDRRAIRQLANDTSAEVLPRLLSAFVTEIDVRAKTVAGAVRSGELDILARESHAIKSSAGTFGARNVCSLATDLNRACKDRQRGAAIGLANRLVEEIQRSAHAYRTTFGIAERP